MQQILPMLLLAAATASIATTISRSNFFEGLRSWIENKSEFLGELIRCIYCTTHWVAIIGVTLYRPGLSSNGAVVLDWTVDVFVTITLSMILSGIFLRLHD